MRRATSGPRHRKLLLLCLGMMALLALSGCRGEEAFRIVEIQIEGSDESDLGAFTLSLFPHIFVPPVEGDRLSIPFRAGDRIAVDFGSDGAWIPIFDSDGDTLVFSSDDEVLHLGDRPVGLDLTHGDGWVWLGHATPEEKQSLRIVAMGDSLSSSYTALLEDLATHNPTFDLYLGEVDLLPVLLSIFDPSSLTWEDDDLHGDQAEALSGEPELKSLMLTGNDIADLAFLSRLPKLEYVFLGEWDPTETGPFPDSLPSLRSLVLFETGLADLSALGSQPQLEELTITECEGGDETGTLDISQIGDLPRIQLLAFRACEVEDLSHLNQLSDLEWLALPSEMNQADFERVMATHTDLTFLELFESEEITDLTPLTRLTKLQGLLIGSGAPPDPLFEMDHLKYLAVMEDEDSSSFDSGVAIRLKAELPTTTLGRIEPFCLGSGLILLLIPMVGFFAVLLARREKGWLAPRHHE